MLDLNHLINTFFLMNMKDIKEMNSYEIIKFGILMFIASHIMNILKYFYILIKPFFDNLLDSLKHPGSTMDIIIKRDTKRYNKIDESIKSIYWHIYKHKLYKKCKSLITLDYICNVFINNKTIELSIAFPTEFTKIDDDIYIKCYKEYNNSSSKDNDTKTIDTIDNYHLIIKCYSNYTIHIDEFINKCIKELEHDKKSKHLKIYTINGDKNDSLDMSEEIPNLSTKTFNTVFFEDKDKLLQKLDTFTTQKSTYKKLGIPHTLGILFSGNPGTGKSSCIKALASRLNRDIVIVNMKTINNNDQFKNIFKSYSYDDLNEKDDTQRKLFVFEEIDCYTDNNKNPFRSRVLAPVTQTKTKTSLTDALLLAKEDTKKDKDTSQLYTKDILETLDGIIECTDRICIFTTNHVNVLDPAFLRPGRIDMHIEFKNMRSCDINNMFFIWFDYYIPQEDLKFVIDYKYSQADIGKLFMEHLNDPKIIIEKLKN